MVKERAAGKRGPAAETEREMRSPERKKFLGKSLITVLLFAAAFFCGELAAKVKTERAEETVPVFSDGSWGLSFPEEGEAPVGNVSSGELEAYDAYYRKDTKEKILYLTFDCGYENGNTVKILDALKKHKAPATFFAVGNYLTDCPELIQRMVKEGHTVGNHSMHHPDMRELSDAEAFRAELEPVERLYREITGEEMARYFRPPQGTYSENSLKLARDLGYQTFFWSLAYVDWEQDRQPGREEALAKLLGRTHPGAIVLLHNTSDTNGAILDELLTRWEEMGYRFGTLEEF